MLQIERKFNVAPQNRIEERIDSIEAGAIGATVELFCRTTSANDILIGPALAQPMDEYRAEFFYGAIKQYMSFDPEGWLMSQAQYGLPIEQDQQLWAYLRSVGYPKNGDPVSVPNVVTDTPKAFILDAVPIFRTVQVGKDESTKISESIALNLLILKGGSLHLTIDTELGNLEEDIAQNPPKLIAVTSSQPFNGIAYHDRGNKNEQMKRELSMNQWCAFMHALTVLQKNKSEFDIKGYQVDLDFLLEPPVPLLRI